MGMISLECIFAPNSPTSDESDAKPKPIERKKADYPHYTKVTGRLIRCVVLGNTDSHENEDIRGGIVEQYSGYILSHTNVPLLVNFFFFFFVQEIYFI